MHCIAYAYCVILSLYKIFKSNKAMPYSIKSIYRFVVLPFNRASDSPTFRTKIRTIDFHTIEILSPALKICAIIFTELIFLTKSYHSNSRLLLLYYRNWNESLNWKVWNKLREQSVLFCFCLKGDTKTHGTQIILDRSLWLRWNWNDFGTRSSTIVLAPYDDTFFMYLVYYYIMHICIQCVARGGRDVVPALESSCIWR